MDAAIDRHAALAGDASSDRTATDHRGAAVDVSEEQSDDGQSSDSAAPGDASREITIGQDVDAAVVVPDDADAAAADEPDASSLLDADAGGSSDASDLEDSDASEGPFDNPSCVALAATCGASNKQSCCSRATLPGGTFKRSYDGVTNTNQGYPATVSSFTLDRFEATVGRFRTFVEAGFGTQAKPPPNGAGALVGTVGSGWSSADNGNLEADSAALMSGLMCNASYQTWTDAAGSNESRPIDCLTWYEAFAFCIWDGARLPTEAEWNYAAAGGSEQRVYPWSIPASSITISEVNASYWLDPTQQCYGDGVNGCSLADLIFAGSKPAGNGRWGHADLGGNVWEWARDTYDSPYAIINCVDCVDLSKGTARVIRGGSFFGSMSTLMAAGRAQGTAGTRYYTVGLRCAR